MADYPRTETTNDGLMIQFNTRAEHVAAYNGNPKMFMHKPPEEEIIPPAVVDELMKDTKPQAVAMAESYKPPERKRGRPARRQG